MSADGGRHASRLFGGLDDWLLHRPEGLRSDLLFTDHGRQINASLIETVVCRAAERVGLGRVTPHRLRHTLATQELRRKVHRRMLGNGYCARPVEMDCHFESICESCHVLRPTIEFRPTLERQRDDAATKDRSLASRSSTDSLAAGRTSLLT